MESNLSPIGWALRPLKRYAEFSGRSSRAELWWFFLMMFIVYMIVWFAFAGAIFSSLVAAGQTGSAEPTAGVLGGLGIGMLLMALVALLLIIPTLAVQVRRLHDTDRSGWWLGGYYLLYLVYMVMAFGSVFSSMNASMTDPTQPPQVNGGMFGATMILGLLLFVYMIALLVFYCLPGTKGQNRFGADPYGQDVEQVFA